MFSFSLKHPCIYVCVFSDPSKKNQKKKKNKDRVVDHSYLLWEIYRAMLVGMTFSPKFDEFKNSGYIILISG